MIEEIDSLLQLYDYSPTLVLFENLLDVDQTKEREAILTVSKLTGREELNPIDVVLESTLNVVSEDISRKKITHPTDKVLINTDIRNLAVERILRLIDNDKRKLRKLHHLWLHRLDVFLNQLYQKRKNLSIDEVIFLVSTQFRISALSAIRAIARAFENSKRI